MLAKIIDVKDSLSLTSQLDFKTDQLIKQYFTSNKLWRCVATSAYRLWDPKSTLPDMHILLIAWRSDLSRPYQHQQIEFIGVKLARKDEVDASMATLTESADERSFQSFYNAGLLEPQPRRANTGSISGLKTVSIVCDLDRINAAGENITRRFP